MLFLDHQNDIKIGGFNTPLAQYVIDIQETPMFNHPLPATKFLGVAQDIQALAIISMKMFLPHQFPLKEKNFTQLTTKMPANYQQLLQKILVMKTPSYNIIELRSNTE